jgi:hypothetical protein
MAELSCVAGMVNLRRTGCGPWGYELSFWQVLGVYRRSAETERFGSAVNLRRKPLAGQRTGKFAVRWWGPMAESIGLASGHPPAWPDTEDDRCWEPGGGGYWGCHGSCCGRAFRETLAGVQTA